MYCKEVVIDVGALFIYDDVRRPRMKREGARGRSGMARKGRAQRKETDQLKS
jgi:hypothetical protein